MSNKGIVAAANLMTINEFLNKQLNEAAANRKANEAEEPKVKRHHADPAKKKKRKAKEASQRTNRR